MITNSVISPISLAFNNSCIAHMGSRVYRIGLQTLGGLFGDTFGPNQLYSGERLYQLVDTYRQSKRDETRYDRARFYYAGGIATALRGERDPVEKTRKAKSILNTHIMGLSILQAKHKASLSKHISYTLLPSLIEDFGKKMANRSIVTLHELDSLDASRNDNVNQYVNLYRDIGLQHKELDSFVQALDQLDSGISKDILINELLLARNRHLSKPAKEKIAAILQSKHYINIKLHNKLQMVELIRNSYPKAEFNESAILSTLRENRDNQLQALCHRGPSMFFASDELDNISLDESKNECFGTNEAPELSESDNSQNNQLEDLHHGEPSTLFKSDSDELDNISLDESKNECFDTNETPELSESDNSQNNRLEDLHHGEPSTLFKSDSDELDNISLDKKQNEYVHTDESQNVSLRKAMIAPLPVGICNFQSNCWYNAALQILIHTPIYQDILQQRKKFASDLPSIFASFNLYERILQDSLESKLLNINNYIPHIRKEAQDNLDKEFNAKETLEEDSIRFLILLLNHLSIDNHFSIWLPGEEIQSVEEKHLLLQKGSPSLLNDSNRAAIKIDLSSLFVDTNHQLHSIIFHKEKRGSRHYFAAVKIKDSWYICNDSTIKEVSEATIEKYIQKNTALLIASRIDIDQTESDVD